MPEPRAARARRVGPFTVPKRRKHLQVRVFEMEGMERLDVALTRPVPLQAMLDAIKKDRL